MSDSSKGSPAWTISPAEYLAGRAKTATGGIERRSLYVAARDGVRLAVDIHLPAGEAAVPRPTIVLFTPIIAASA